MKRIGVHLTYANVVATVLAFLVLGGGSAYAVTKYLKVRSNSVGGKQLKDASVGLIEIGPGAVHTPNIANKAVTNPKLANGAVDLTNLAGPVQDAYSSSEDTKRLVMAPAACNGSASSGCEKDVLVNLLGLTLHGSCSESGGNETVLLTATAADGSVNMESVGGLGAGGSSTTDHQGGFVGPGEIDEVTAPGGSEARAVGRAIYHSSGDSVVAVSYQLYAVHIGGATRCELFGRAVGAP